MPETKSKLLIILLIVLAITGTIYFALYEGKGAFMQSSLLNGQARVDLETAKNLEKQGYSCRLDYLYKQDNCEETKFGKTCSLTSKATDNYVCTPAQIKIEPEEEEPAN